MSLVISRIAVPSSASRRNSSWMYALVLMSMPTEGSSTMRILTPAASHLATLIFCWLPPDRLPTICASEGVRTSSWAMTGEGFVTPAVACWMYVRAVAEGMRKISYAGYRFPPEVIHQAIWLYLRFTLSFRDVEDLLAERGIAISYETVRRWGNHFGPMIAGRLRKRRPKPHATWHLDEVYLKIDGRMVCGAPST